MVGIIIRGCFHYVGWPGQGKGRMVYGKRMNFKLLKRKIEKKCHVHIFRGLHFLHFVG